MMWVLLVVWVALLVLWVWTIVESARSDYDDWAGVRPGKGVWVTTLVFFGWIASFGYLIAVRPQVRRNHEARARATEAARARLSR